MTHIVRGLYVTAFWMVSNGDYIAVFGNPRTYEFLGGLVFGSTRRVQWQVDDDCEWVEMMLFVGLSVVREVSSVTSHVCMCDADVEIVSRDEPVWRPRDDVYWRQDALLRELLLHGRHGSEPLQ